MARGKDNKFPTDYLAVSSQHQKVSATAQRRSPPSNLLLSTGNRIPRRPRRRRRAPPPAATNPAPPRNPRADPIGRRRPTGLGGGGSTPRR
eukprot:1192086-Prorocentrum_minimum.AAC.2